MDCLNFYIVLNTTSWRIGVIVQPVSVIVNIGLAEIVVRGYFELWSNFSVDRMALPNQAILRAVAD